MVNIHDFNTGVSYTINMKADNCTMRPLNDSFDSMHDGDDDVHMKSPFQMFWQDPESLRYQGVGLTRQIETNVWIQNSTVHRNGINYRVSFHYYLYYVHQ